jgi:Flp pilus assembly protein TadG
MWRSYRTGKRGGASVEFALLATVLAIPLLNVIDLCIYIYDMMAVQSAAQAGATAAGAACGVSSNLPALPSNCPQLAEAVNAAAQSTWLGTSITTDKILVTEHFYCVKSNSVAWTEVPSLNSNCVNYGGLAADKPGDYIQVKITYTYTPMLPALSITSVLGGTIQPTSYMRLG